MMRYNKDIALNNKYEKVWSLNVKKEEKNRYISWMKKSGKRNFKKNEKTFDILQTTFRGNPIKEIL